MASRRPARVGGRTAQALAGRYRAVAPDLPGHGQANHRTASFDACAAYVRALAPARTFTLAGYSMGGRIALHSALTLGPEIVTRLVLIGASPGLADPAERAARRTADDALAARIETLTIEAFAAEWGAQPLFADQPPRVAAAANADRLRNTPFGLATRAARPRDRRHGTALGAAAAARDPGHARGRRARREVPRARRGDARAATERAAGRRARCRARGAAGGPGGRRGGDSPVGVALLVGFRVVVAFEVLLEEFFERV